MAEKKVMVEMVELEVDLDEQTLARVNHLCKITGLEVNTIMSYIITNYIVEQALKGEALK